MSKAVLVLDMPESCSKCDYMANALYDGNVCILKVVAENYKKIGNVIKPDWCPLWELPEKRPEEAPITYSHFGAYNDGWNACIDEITGGAE